MSGMSYKGYIGSVELHDEDDCLYGKVQFIRSLLSYEGKTATELKRAFEQTIDDYLQFCREQHIEAEKPFKGSFNVRIESDLHRRAAIASIDAGIKLNEFVKTAIAEKLERHR